MNFINTRAVDVFTISGQFVGHWDSAADAIRALNIQHLNGNVRSCLLGNRNHAGGYIWNYKPTEVKILKGEKWKPVVGFEDLYAVSNNGRVASLQFHGKPGFSLMTQSNMKGYPAVKIRNSKTGFSQSLKVHRLVAEAFIPNPENKPHVDHIDTNPENNNVKNLRWVTILENQRNPITLSKISKNMKAMNYAGVGPKAAAIKRCIRVKNESTIYNSAQEAGKATGHTTSVILRWCRANRHGWSLV